jgi:hypothetical protein
VKIEIHGVNAAGQQYRLNEFRQENAAANTPKLLDALRKKAAGDAVRWQKIYPDDKISVVEIPSGTARTDVLERRRRSEARGVLP